MKKQLVALLIIVFSAHALLGQIQVVPSADFINALTQSKNSKTFKWQLTDTKTITINFESFVKYDNGISSFGTIEGSSFSNAMFKVNNDEVFGYALYLDKELGFSFISNDYNEVEINRVDPHEFFHITDYDNVPTRKFEDGFEPFDEEVESVKYPHVQPYEAGMDMHALESKPGAPNVIYLEWDDVFNGNQAKNLTNEQMYYVWAGTAAGYISFDVNVTTNPSVYNSVPVTNSCVAEFKDHDARSHAPGDSWGTANASTIYTANQTDWYVNTLVHEIGHQLGLDHDGSPHQEYFKGVEEYDWNSIMGHTWYANFLQYSKGEYTGANNFEDDLSVIGGYIPYRNDGVSASTPLVLDADEETINLNDNIAHIEHSGDADVYEFTINKPRILSLNIRPLEYRTMLDVHAILQDPNGNVIADSNVDLNRHAEFNSLLLSETGTYKVLIKGGAEGTPDWGFSNYSSVGVYGISGTLEKLKETNAQLISLAPFEDVCNKYTPSINIKNIGNQTISSIEFEIKVDNGAPQTHSANNLSIPSLSSTSIELNELTQIGNNIPLSVEVKNINGNSPAKENVIGLTYTLGEGVPVELNITDIAYPFTNWTITNTSGATIIEQSDVIELVQENGDNKMRFCLAEDCYDLNISHDLESCSNLSSWSASQNYQANSVVTHQAKDSDGNLITYTNKWWASGTNVPGGGDPWEETGICTGSSRGEYSLKPIGGTNYIESSSSASTNTETHNFCPSTITNTQDVLTENDLTIYPNPTNSLVIMELKKGLISNVQITNMKGQLIVNQTPNTSRLELNLNIPNGMYFINIQSNKGFITKSINVIK